MTNQQKVIDAILAADPTATVERSFHDGENVASVKLTDPDDQDQYDLIYIVGWLAGGDKLNERNPYGFWQDFDTFQVRDR